MYLKHLQLHFSDGEKNPEAASLLPDLKEKKIPLVLSSDSIKEYEVSWDPRGELELIKRSQPMTFVWQLCFECDVTLNVS